MYMFPAASNAASAGSQRPASVAGPPSPSCEPPSPATVFMVAASFASSLAPPPPQALSAKRTSVTASPSPKACLTVLLWGYICSSSSATFPTTSCYGEAPYLQRHSQVLDLDLITAVIEPSGRITSSDLTERLLQ